MITFEYPQFAAFFLLPFIVRYLWPSAKGVYGDALKVPFIEDIKNIQKQNTLNESFFSAAGGIGKKWWMLFFVWFLLVLSLMRPIHIGEPIRLDGKSRDILLVTDISTSMLEDDFSFDGRRLNRLGAVRAVVSDFVERRTADKLGLILFGTRAYLQAPLTFDRNSVQEILWSMQAGMAGNSTSIGDALALAIKTLKESNENLNNKVIILLTDGENNDGSLSMPQAISLAKNEGIKVYTIGVGSDKLASLAGVFFGNVVSDLDEKSLQILANETKGQYFRATGLKSLVDIYKAIDILEPEDTKQSYIYPRYELFYIPLLASVLLSSILIYYYRRRKNV